MEQESSFFKSYQQELISVELVKTTFYNYDHVCVAWNLFEGQPGNI